MNDEVFVVYDEAGNQYAIARLPNGNIQAYDENGDPFEIVVEEEA